MRMKKLLLGTLLACMLFLNPVMGFQTAFAEEEGIPSTSSVLAEENETQSDNEAETSEEAVLEEETPVEAVDVASDPTVVSRIEEWFSKNALEILGSVNLTAVAGCLLSIILDKRANRKNTKETNDAVNTNTTAMRENTASNDKVLTVVNQLIDKTNELSASEECRNGVVEQVLLLNKSILEILVTVYVNNKNIPQATKDLVSLKYVKALKGTTNEGSENAEG